MLAFIEKGSGPPVLLVHGFADSGAMWFLSKPDLFRNFHVIAIDLPGHGKSEPWPRPHLTMQDMARELDDLVSYLKLDQFTLIGHSMGGMVAQQYYVEHPQKLNKIVLCSTAVSGSQISELGFNIQDVKRDIMTRGLKETLSADWTSSFAQGVNETLVKKWIELESLTDPETAVKCLDAVNSWRLDAKRTRSHRCNTILVFGNEDKITPPTPCMDSLLAVFKQSQARLIVGAGHMVHLDKPEQFEDAVQQEY